MPILNNIEREGMPKGLCSSETWHLPCVVWVGNVGALASSLVEVPMTSYVSSLALYLLCLLS